VGYDPFSVEVMTDPYPVYRELRARHRVASLPEYDAFALTRFDDVWRVLVDRDRFSIFEGPVFHREALLRHHDGAPDTSVGAPVPTFSMLDPPVHTQLRQALLGPFRPRAVAPMEDTVRQFARARLDQLVGRDEFDVRHDYASPVAAQVAALQLGFPVEDAELLVG
jgi:cytochrome P450